MAADPIESARAWAWADIRTGGFNSEIRRAGGEIGILHTLTRQQRIMMREMFGIIAKYTVVKESETGRSVVILNDKRTAKTAYQTTLTGHRANMSKHSGG